MTRKQAEKIADAIRRIAERDQSPTWTTTEITTTDVAALVKKPASYIESSLVTDSRLIWGCLPMGWRFSRRGTTGITVSRRAE